MTLYLHNMSENNVEFQGKEIPTGDYLIINSHFISDFASDSNLIQAIEDGIIQISRDGVNLIESPYNAIILLTQIDFRSSIAVDKDGVDQIVEGTDPVVIESNRILWDFNDDYDSISYDIVVPSDGIYSFDYQFQISSLVNVSSMELALFKRQEITDDYWFILDKRYILTQTTVQMNGNTLFDFYKDERYTLKIILTKTVPELDCSCTILGSDDYTAWGYNLTHLF